MRLLSSLKYDKSCQLYFMSTHPSSAFWEAFLTCVDERVCVCIYVCGSDHVSEECSPREMSAHDLDPSQKSETEGQYFSSLLQSCCKVSLRTHKSRIRLIHIKYSFWEHHRLVTVFLLNCFLRSNVWMSSKDKPWQIQRAKYQYCVRFRVENQASAR